jgi:hypothetical protein
MVSQLRKSFPATVTSETVKKLGIAPNNESFVINVLQFIGVLDADGKKTSEAAKVFSHHKDDEFAKAFGSLIQKAYSSLFDLHGEDAWKLDGEDLITFFRQSDQTGDIIGKRQATTFKTLAALSGHGDVPTPKTKKSGKNAKSATKSVATPLTKTHVGKVSAKMPLAAKAATPDPNGIGLTVRVEINLPADGTKETYDSIFKSIRENLLGG